MLTQEQNERLTKIGPGTPMGSLMRRYWHPITGSSVLNETNPTKEIRLLGEDLVLYRDTSGTVGLVEPSCAHRKASLAYGVPEANGIRCCYHGWLFNQNGECLEQPSEPEGSRFKEKVRIKAYPVQELGGLIFAYLGPSPAPILPHWDILDWPGARVAHSVMVPANWLQCHENSLDPLHFQWLHRYYGGWVMNRKKPADERDEWNATVAERGADHRKIGFEITDYGVIKRRLVGDETEEDEFWSIGHPILFPSILRVSNNLQYRVPVDDHHTMHLVIYWNELQAGEGDLKEVPFSEYSMFDDNGRFRDDYVLGQDQTAWAIQGPLMDRTTERLGVSDVGIIMFRNLLERQLKTVEDGADPMNVWRKDPGTIVLPVEHFHYPGYPGTGGPFKGQTPRTPDVETILSGEGATLGQ